MGRGDADWGGSGACCLGDAGQLFSGAAGGFCESYAGAKGGVGAGFGFLDSQVFYETAQNRGLGHAQSSFAFISPKN